MESDPLLPVKRPKSNYGSQYPQPTDDERDEQDRPTYHADEFGIVRQGDKSIVTGRMRKKLAARLVGGEFQARDFKRRVYFCCVSSELDIQSLHDHCTREILSRQSKWKIRLYGDALCLSYKTGDRGTSKFDIPRRTTPEDTHITTDDCQSDDGRVGSEFLEERKISSRVPSRSLRNYLDTGDNTLDDIKQEIFVFEFGVVVFWGVSIGQEKGILDLIKDFIKRGDVIQSEFESSEDDMAFVSVAEASKMHIANDVITLPEDSTVKQRLSVSYAIAQSSVVSIFEHRIEEKVTEYKFIPETLSRSGKIDLSNRRIGMMIGDIFVIRHDLNLHTDILDTPDYFWYVLYVCMNVCHEVYCY